MFKLSDAEKIEAIILCSLRGEDLGHFGKVTRIDPCTGWAYRVEVAQGPMVLARTTAAGWEVECRGMVGCDESLETAAYLALEAGRGVSVSRNYPVQLS